MAEYKNGTIKKYIILIELLKKHEYDIYIQKYHRDLYITII